jgi:hypothetical protein
MKKFLVLLAGVLLTTTLAVALYGNKGTKAQTKDAQSKAVPEYTVLSNPTVNLKSFRKDKQGYYILFDGKTFKGWRGYGKDHVPTKWAIVNGCIKFNGTGGGEAQDGDGGDIIFTYPFKNFILELDWKVEKGSNSGIFYLAREVATKDKNGKQQMEPIYISAPEYQVLDNANHPDAQLGENGNRQSASLYDMIPAKPQNSKPYGQWNKAKIMVYKGTVVHGQNGKNVLEYHLWTQRWNDMLQNSKFSETNWPLAYELLNNCGGPRREGYIGLQDHGDVVWYKNIRIKVLE